MGFWWRRPGIIKNNKGLDLKDEKVRSRLLNHVIGELREVSISCHDEIYFPIKTLRAWENNGCSFNKNKLKISNIQKWDSSFYFYSAWPFPTKWTKGWIQTVRKYFQNWIEWGSCGIFKWFRTQRSLQGCMRRRNFHVFHQLRSNWFRMHSHLFECWNYLRWPWVLNFN